MCLDSVELREPFMEPACVAFKVVQMHHYHSYPTWESGFPVGTPLALYYPIRTGYTPDIMGSRIRPKEIGQGWALSDSAAPVPDSRGWAEYLPGVHAYKLMADAVKAVEMAPGLRVVKVYLRGPIAAGHQHGCPVVVYREMTLIKDLMAW